MTAYSFVHTMDAIVDPAPSPIQVASWIRSPADPFGSNGAPSALPLHRRPPTLLELVQQHRSN